MSNAAYASANAYVLAGLEGTRGTLSSALKDIPVLGPQLTPMQKFLADEGLRGSPVARYGNIPGVANSNYETKLNVFDDTFPIFVRAALGAADSVTDAPSSTTLAAEAEAAATSVSLTASCAVGSAICIAAGTATQETHIISEITGSGPYTATLATPLVNPQANAATVTGLTAHLLQLLDDTSGSQPPSVSFQDFDGANAYQILAAQLSELTLTHAAEKALECTVKFVGNPYTSISAPSLTVGTEHFVPSWAAVICIGGTQVTNVEEGQIAIKRNNTASVWTENLAGGTATPFVNFAGPIDVTGSDTFIVPSTSDPTLTEATTFDKLTIVREWMDPQTGHMIHIQTSQTQLTNPKRLRGKFYVEVSADFDAEANPTDAANGFAPISITVCNAVSTPY